jgi:hypothetical protein
MEKGLYEELGFWISGHLIEEVGEEVFEVLCLDY